MTFTLCRMLGIVPLLTLFLTKALTINDSTDLQDICLKAKVKYKYREKKVAGFCLHFKMKIVYLHSITIFFNLNEYPLS